MIADAGQTSVWNFFKQLAGYGLNWGDPKEQDANIYLFYLKNMTAMPPKLKKENLATTKKDFNWILCSRTTFRKLELNNPFMIL